MGNGKTDNGGNANLKRRILSLDLKIPNSLEYMSVEGREFHVLKPELEKALLPILVLALGTLTIN